MFGAIKLYDQLMEQYPDESFEVATIAGSSKGGVEADRKMVKELVRGIRDLHSHLELYWLLMVSRTRNWCR